MIMTDWPEMDRPYEKLLRLGQALLTDAELLAILFKTGTKGQTALDLAKNLLIESGDLQQLEKISLATFLQKKGLGKAKYVTLHAAIELGKRCHVSVLPLGTVLANPQQSIQFLMDQLKHDHNEIFAGLFLDTRCRVLAFEKLCEGTVHEAHLYPREIIRRALKHNAAKMILAHNHPSGHVQPSQSDQQVTTLLKNALRYVDVEIVDHIIIGHKNDVYFSFAEAGWIE